MCSSATAGRFRLLAAYLTDEGFGASRLWIMERLGGPGERITSAVAGARFDQTFEYPVCVAMEVAGDGAPVPLAAGRPDTWFENDGQITKRPVRALTLSALAPRPHEHLWDIGSGSGSVAIEWLLAGPSLGATAIEVDPARAARIRTNADRLGVDRLKVIEGRAPGALEGLTAPDVVFVGGGLGAGLLDWILENLAAGTRLVANAVTLESEAFLIGAQARLGGQLMRVEIAQAAPIGPRTGWKAAYPITQWSHIL